MADKQTFKTVLEKHPGMNATGITIPFDVEKVFGAKRVAVKAVINGADYRGSIVRMGGTYCLGIPKVFRDAAGIEAGDHIVVTLERDIEPRIVTPPKDFAAALSIKADAAVVWEKLSFTHKKEYVNAILEAKRPETRARRIEKAVKMLAAMKKK
jgi:bifunctional DNA-binding transcriptional regulator/antitoxin component of YhaV-PrlF toxin-antitoxin module